MSNNNKTSTKLFFAALTLAGFSVFQGLDNDELRASIGKNNIATVQANDNKRKADEKLTPEAYAKKVKAIEVKVAKDNPNLSEEKQSQLVNILTSELKGPEANEDAYFAKLDEVQRMKESLEKRRPMLSAAVIERRQKQIDKKEEELKALEPKDAQAPNAQGDNLVEVKEQISKHLMSFKSQIAHMAGVQAPIGDAQTYMHSKLLLLCSDSATVDNFLALALYFTGLVNEPHAKTGINMTRTVIVNMKQSATTPEELDSFSKLLKAIDVLYARAN